MRPAISNHVFGAPHRAFHHKTHGLRLVYKTTWLLQRYYTYSSIFMRVTIAKRHGRLYFSPWEYSTLTQHVQHTSERTSYYNHSATCVAKLSAVVRPESQVVQALQPLPSTYSASALYRSDHSTPTVAHYRRSTLKTPHRFLTRSKTHDCQGAYLT